MTSKFDEQLENLKVQIKEMGKDVENIIKTATDGFIEGNMDSANETIENFPEIENKEREIENLALKLLLKQQPVASDFRTISAILKIITDMKRIGTQAMDISYLTRYLIEQNEIKQFENINKMSKESMKIVSDSIAAFINKDLELANSVIEYDDVIDKLFDDIKEELVKFIKDDSLNGKQALDLIMIAKYFERIGDHAVHIARWTVFSITGTHPE